MIVTDNRKTGDIQEGVCSLLCCVEPETSSRMSAVAICAVCSAVLPSYISTVKTSVTRSSHFRKNKGCPCCFYGIPDLFSVVNIL
jgi:hypothetical protein